MPRVSEESILPVDTVDGDTFSDAVRNSRQHEMRVPERVKVVMLPVARDGFSTQDPCL